MTRKVVFVTGAARNTGYAIAHRFAREGFDVCISSRNAADAEAAAALIRQACPGITVAGYAMDPADTADIQRVFGLIREQFGRLDCLVPNAINQGIGQNIINTTPESFDAVMSVNVRGYFFCCQEAAKIMIAQKSGCMVLIGSVQYKGALPNRITYITSKGAISSLSRCLAYELARYGIRVNCLIPGAIWTQRWEEQAPEVTQRRRDQYPVGRESTPEEVANAAWFLASEQSPTMTGSELVVDSGISMCILPYDRKWDEK